MKDEYKKILEKEGFKHVYEWDDAPDTEYPPHKHVGKVSMYITEGEITMIVEGKKIELKRGDRYDVPVAAVHTAKVGKTDVVSLLAKW
jgi:quercetin dioxygenase-like cupin family protein